VISPGAFPNYLAEMRRTHSFNRKYSQCVLDSSGEGKLSLIGFCVFNFQVENSISTYDPHATIVVYSVTDRASYRTASEILRYLWQEGITQEKAVILVGNKCDLARARVVSTHGKQLCLKSYAAQSIPILSLPTFPRTKRNVDMNIIS